MSEPDKKFVSNEEAQATTRVIAVIFLGIGLAIAYWVWPTGATDLTLASMTFGTFLRAIGSGAIAIAFLIGFALLWVD